MWQPLGVGSSQCPAGRLARSRHSPAFFAAISHEGLSMFGIGNTELIVIAVVALILFGHRLPSTMFSLGQGFRKLKEGMNAASTDDGTEP